MPARIEPYEAPFPPVIEDLLDRMMQTKEYPPIALFRVMAKNLPMASASWNLGRYGLGKELSLHRREREILIDRTTARLGCEYEWGVHVMFFGPIVGLSSEEITSLTHGSSTDPCWTDERERLILDGVDQLVDTHDIDEQLWERLTQHFSESELLDLLCIVGWYHAIGFLARGLRLPLEASAPTFADVAP